MKVIVPYPVTDDNLVSNSVSETVTAYDVGGTYDTSDTALDEATHSIYESQQDGNTGNPLTDLAWWVRTGPSNPWAMFDTLMGTQTQDADGITAVVDVVGRADSIALLNIAGDSVEITSAIVAPGTQADDFTTGVLPDGYTFTRATAGTYIDDSGVMQTAAIDEARFDYDPVTNDLLGILIESAATNRIQHSNDFGDASWTVNNVTVVTGKTDPAGGTTAAELTGGSGGGYILNSGASGGSDQFENSIYVRRVSGTGTINLSTPALANAAITPTSSWQRFSSAASLTNTGGADPGYILIGVVDTGDKIEVAFADQELSPVTSYIPTPTSPATRDEDVLTFTVPAGASTLTFTFDDDSTQDVSVTPGSYIVPTDLDRPHIKTISYLSDTVSTPLYDETFDLNNLTGINNWFAYFYNPIVRASNLIVTNLPTTYGPTITMALDATGGTGKVGSYIIGLAKDLGRSLYGLTLGIRDFSVKTTDDFGTYTVIQRPFSKKATFKVWVANEFLDSVIETLEALRATPCIWMATNELGQPYSNSSTVFGFATDWNIEVSGPNETLLTIETEGLT